MEEDINLIKSIETGLHQSGINWMANYESNNDLSWTAQYFIKTNMDKEKYDEINNWLLGYTHKPYVICPWSGKKITDPEAQLLNRFQNWNKYRCDNGDMDE